MADRPSRPPRAVPRGTVKPLDEDDLAKLAEITPEDIEDAHAAWRQVRDGYETLLDADPAPEDDPNAST